MIIYFILLQLRANQVSALVCLVLSSGTYHHNTRFVFSIFDRGLVECLEDDSEHKLLTNQRLSKRKEENFHSFCQLLEKVKK